MLQDTRKFQRKRYTSCPRKLFRIGKKQHLVPDYAVAKGFQFFWQVLEGVGWGGWVNACVRKKNWKDMDKNKSSRIEDHEMNGDGGRSNLSLFYWQDIDIPCLLECKRCWWSFFKKESAVSWAGCCSAFAYLSLLQLSWLCTPITP